MHHLCQLHIYPIALNTGAWLRFRTYLRYVLSSTLTHSDADIRFNLPYTLRCAYLSVVHNCTEHRLCVFARNVEMASVQWPSESETDSRAGEISVLVSVLRVNDNVSQPSVIAYYHSAFPDRSGQSALRHLTVLCEFTCHSCCRSNCKTRC